MKLLQVTFEMLKIQMLILPLKNMCTLYSAAFTIGNVIFGDCAT